MDPHAPRVVPFVSAGSEPQRRPLSQKPRAFQFERYVGERAKLINDALERAVPASGRPEELSEAMRYSLLAPGKRVRPVLCLAACELVGGRTEAALGAACAVEMVHTMSLIHDDLPAMDDDDYRRGRLACHKKFGENIAILAGDALLALSFEVAAARVPDGVSPDRVLLAVREIARATGLAGLAGGQAVDLLSEGAGASVDESVLRFIHEHKTGSLLEAAVVAGALLGNGDDASVARLRRYAGAVGLAFQIVDDVLDVTASSEQLGKTAGKDSASDKATYPSLIGLEASRTRADELVAEAKAQLEGFDPDKAAPLVAIADYIRSRSS